MECDDFFCKMCGCSQDGSTRCCRGHTKTTTHRSINSSSSSSSSSDTDTDTDTAPKFLASKHDLCIACAQDPVCTTSGCNCSLSAGVQYCKLHYTLPNHCVAADGKCLYCTESHRLQYHQKKIKTTATVTAAPAATTTTTTTVGAGAAEYIIPHNHASYIEQYMWRSVRTYIVNTIQVKYIGGGGKLYWVQGNKGANQLYETIGSRCGLASNGYGKGSIAMAKIMLKWFIGKVKVSSFNQSTGVRSLPW